MLGCTGIGFFYVEKMKQREHQLQQIRRILICMRGEIRYGNETLPEIMMCLKEKTDKIFAAFFSEMEEKLRENQNGTFAQVWKIVSDKFLDRTRLGVNEKKEWMELGENLGHLDREMQINLLTIYEEHFRDYVKEQQNRIKQEEKLYQILGVMSGIFITVILV